MSDARDAGPHEPAPYLTGCEPIDWAEFERWARLSPGARSQSTINTHRPPALSRPDRRRDHLEAVGGV